LALKSSSIYIASQHFTVFTLDTEKESISHIESMSLIRISPLSRMTMSEQLHRPSRIVPYKEILPYKYLPYPSASHSTCNIHTPGDTEVRRRAPGSHCQVVAVQITHFILFTRYAELKRFDRTSDTQNQFVHNIGRDQICHWYEYVHVE